MKIHQLLLSTAFIVSLVGSSMASAADLTYGKGHRPSTKQHKEEVLSKLSTEKAELFKNTMEKVREKNKSVRDQIYKLRDEMKTIIVAEKFDKDAFLTKNANMDKLYGQMRANNAEAFASVAEQFTPDERKILSELPRAAKGSSRAHSDKEADYQSKSDSK